MGEYLSDEGRRVLIEKATSGLVAFLLIALVLTPVSAWSLGGTKEAQRGSDAVLPDVLVGNVVANTGSIDGISWQQKTFFAANRYWVFFMNGTSNGIYDTGTACYSSSADGLSWETSESIASNMTESSGENLQVMLTSGGYIDVFARCINHTLAIFYMRGVPNSDGTITWLTGWQTAWLMVQANVDFYAIVDSNGYPWISWGYGLTSRSIYIYVTKDAYNNGTWQTASGFPIQLTSTPYTNDFMVPLSNGRVYVMYFSAPGLIYGKLWNGTGFGSEETTSTSQVMPQFAYAGESWSRSVVVDSLDNIYVLFLSTTQNLVFVQRSMSSGWNSETIIQTGVANYSSPSLNLVYDQWLQAYWVYNSSSIVFKNFIDGTWDANPTFIVNEQDEIPTVAGPSGYDGRLNSFTQTFGPYACLLWIANSTTPDTYNVKFALVTLFEHDVGISVSAAKDRIGLGYTVNFSVLLANNGLSSESLNFTLLTNSTVIGIGQINLNPMSHVTVWFSWNTSGLSYGNYTISAYVRPVPGETNIANNNCTGGWVTVSIPGDITGPNGYPDGMVDMRDIGYVARRFLCTPGSSLWDPNADINSDGVVNMTDIGIVARNFGQHYVS